MNLWSTTDDNSSMMEGFMSSNLTPFWPSTPSLPPASPQSSCGSTTTNTIDPSKSFSQSQPSVPFFNEENLQQRLQTVIDGARESWTYAIFWQASSGYYAGPSLLGWGDGYYKGEEDKCKRNTASSAEQEHRKKVLRELNSLVSGEQAPTDETVDEVTDTEWFFLVSMTQSFVNGNGLPGQAFFNSSPVWVAGADRLAFSHCERARQAQVFGLQTLVCIPSSYGVVELGSTELIFQSSDLMNKVSDFFNVNSIEMGSGSGARSESESSASFLTDPSSSAKKSVNTASGNSISSLSHLVRQYLRNNSK